MNRLSQLDGVRGLAILMVVCCHIIIALLPEGRGVFGDALEWVFASGVDLFFVLSGFLISGLLLDVKGQKNVLKPFYMRRILRIFPLYYAVLFFYGVVLAGLFPEGHGYGKEWLTHPWGNIFFFCNFQFFAEAQLPRTPVSANWSLAVEEHFYLVWPSVVLFLSTRKYIVACLLVCAAALVVRYGLIINGANDNQILIFTFARMDSFAVGGLLAWAWREPHLFAHISPHFKAGMMAGLGIPLATYAATELSPGFKQIWQPWNYSLSNLGFASLIGYALCHPQCLSGVFQSSWLRSFGTYSYAIYLTNVGVVYGLILLLGYPTDWFGGAGVLLFIPLVLLSVWLIGKLLYHGIEKPFLEMKSRFPLGASRVPSHSVTQETPRQPSAS